VWNLRHRHKVIDSAEKVARRHRLAQERVRTQTDCKALDRCLGPVGHDDHTWLRRKNARLKSTPEAS
jgi:hypothetical protein